MTKNRLEAFSDGVIAIIITIMVLELKVPHGDTWQALLQSWPVFFSYVLSFIYVAIYWNNHHHLYHGVEKINGRVLWANLFLLFWMSLIPFVTGWMGENHFAPAPVALYGVVLLMCAIAWWIMQHVLLSIPANRARLARVFGRDLKGRLSPLFYLLGILATFRWEWVSAAIYALVALLWLVPDSRIERLVGDSVD